jgi:cellulose synthase/poly-beta-1,6-N-acetylglucosamine synthase-like glycosyltransferase
MTLIFILIFFAYVIFVVLLTRGWDKSINRPVLRDCRPEVLVSIIVPVRNEQANIGCLLEDLQRQSHRSFETIIVNDHSRDQTNEIVLKYAQPDPRFMLLQSQGEGKKKALTTGINASRGEIIVTTDGDCRLGEDWLKTMLKHFQFQSTKMVFGGVRIIGSSFFSNVQAHEFLSLVGTSAATLWYGFPSMCNAANLAFRKAAFLEVGGYADNLHIASGDDEFLMRKIWDLYPGGIQFVGEDSAVVTTIASPSLKSFIHQRVRWAGKWKHNISSGNAALAMFIFFLHLSVLFLPVAIALGWVSVGIATILLFSKVSAEAIFLKKIADFVKVPWSWSVFTFLQIFYPVYTIWVGTISSFSNFEWKGRKIKSVAFSTVKK